MERCGLSLQDAGISNSVYFFARTVGAFVGGILLMKIAEVRFYTISIWTALVGLILLVISKNMALFYVSIVVFGLGYANLFSIIFSLSMKHMPSRANDVSALLIVGLVGGGVLPPLLGLFTDGFKTQVAAVFALVVIWVYMFWLMKRVKTVSSIG